MELLQSKGFWITGIDPAYEGQNPNIKKQNFAPDLVLETDAIILRHTLEHIQSPFDFLSNISLSNGEKGLIYIEVPCFDWICKNHAWFDIYYEHVNYFRLKYFQNMFGKILEYGYVFSGQYIYVIADLATLKKPIFNEEKTFDFPPNFQDTIELFSSELRSKKYRSGLNLIVWGAASKGVIFSYYMQKQNISIDYIVDINPKKQGKYLPASGLYINSPIEIKDFQEKSACSIVMNSNYFPEIRQLTNNKFEYFLIDNEVSR